jgi:hypothetical protein
MNWERLLTSPPPSSGWVFDSEMVAVAHRSKTEEIHCASEDIPAGGLEVGPVGLQVVNDRSLGPALARLKGAAGGTESAAVIVPTSWLRSFLVDVDRLPRKESELLDVVRWRLKKLLPVVPTELRLAVVRLSEIEGQRRILVMAGLERAMAGLETAFSDIGIEVGLITTRLFALVPRLGGLDRPMLVIQHEERVLSLLLLLEGAPRLLRTKPLSRSNGGRDAVRREATLTLSFIRESIGLGDEIEVRVSCEQAEMDAVIREWMTEHTALVPAVEKIGPACGPTTVVNRLGPARLAPALAVVSGELR